MKKNYLLSILMLFLALPLPLKAQDAPLPSLLITEIAAFEASGYEWVEVYNTTDAEISMDSIYFYEDATKHRLNLYGADLLLGPKAYGVIVQDPVKFLEKYPTYAGKIFDSSWSTLREDGEEIGLMQKSDGSFLEKFTYVPAPDNSLKRKSFNLDYSVANWDSAGDPSPGQENVFPAPQSEIQNVEPTVEPAPAPAPETPVQTPTEEPVTETPPTEESPSATAPAVPAETQASVISVGSFSIPNQPPKALIEIQSGTPDGEAPLTINLDGSHSTDPEKDTLTYAWDFGDGHTETTKNPRPHIYKNPNNYEVALKVTDSQGNTDTAHVTVHVRNTKIQTTMVTEKPKEKTTFHAVQQEQDEAQDPIPQNGDLSSLIKITELMPNPDGPDNEDEWIELYNPEARDIRLGGWTLDDSEGGSKPYVFPETAAIPKHGFLVVTREDSKIALNNSTDMARLFDFQGTLISQVSYEKTKEGKSYALINSSEGIRFEWTDDVTPGEKNPRYEPLAGKIVSLSPDLETAVLADESGKKSSVIVGDILEKDLAKASLVKDAAVDMEVKRNGDGTFSLRKLFDVEPPPETPEKPAGQKEAGIPAWAYAILIGSGLLNLGIFAKQWFHGKERSLV